MILNIFVNEFKGALPRGNLTERILKSLFLLLGAGLFVALEVYLFLALDAQFQEFSSYGSDDFLVLFLFLYFLLSSLATLPSAHRSLYRDIDEKILSPLPIPPDDVILGKGLYLYLRLALSSLLLATPILVAYGSSRSLDPSFYVLSAAYPFIVSFVGIGLTMALLPLYERVYSFLSGRYLLQLILGTLIAIALCFLYQYVLSLFLSVVQGSRLDQYVSASFLTGLHEVAAWLIPCSSIFSLMRGTGNLVSSLFFLLGSVFLMAFLGLYLLSFLYNRNKEALPGKEGKRKSGGRANKVLSLDKALLKKEFILLFRNGSYLFSFTSLLFMQPFLAYVVISSLSSLLYGNLAIFLDYFSELPNGITLLVLLLFASILTSGASDGITREGKGRLLLKTTPVSPLKATFYKLLIPVGVSVFSFLVTNIVLLFFGEIAWPLFFVSLVTGSLLIVSVASYGLLSDISSYSLTGKRGVYEFFPTIISILFPLFVAGLHFLLMFLKLPSYAVYLSEVGLALLLLLPLCYLPFRLKGLYLSMGATV